ncbi:MAG: glycosyltransferase, partial [Candidatus Marsarchaeota archaeon]|nr:glycosyltransferase [Candidatus Marsarchaeota archaeon]
MRILIISPYLPYPPIFGSAARIYHLMRHLCRHHDISFVCLGEVGEYSEERVEAIKELCERVTLVPMRGISWSLKRQGKRLRQLRASLSRRPYQYFTFYAASMQLEIERHLAEEDYDVVQVEFPQMAYYRFPPQAKLVLSMHNIEHEIFYRTFVAEKSLLRKFYNYLEWLKFRYDEIRLCAKFETIVTTSQREVDTLSRSLPNRLLTVVPNGVDTEFFQTTGFEPEPNTLIFTGTIQYYPNTDAVTYFVQEILPHIRQEVPDVK